MDEWYVDVGKMVSLWMIAPNKTYYTEEEDQINMLRLI